jgi:tRNA pseudouridine13 synthase
MTWLERGLENARVLGTPASSGYIRQCAGDFRVDERLAFAASGSGGHLLLQVEKTGLNTVDVAGMLAAHGGVAPRDVGYSGLKDRHAVCTQWFTLPFSSSVDWQTFQRTGVRILFSERHNRKLKRGAHTANRFRIRVVLDHLDADDLDRRLHAVRVGGAPNYFGEQRFGRRFEDNARRLVAGQRLPRLQRSMTLSGIRSELFNRVLDYRVGQGSWNKALDGEYVNLDGTRSGFAAPGGDPEIARRIDAMDLHPTGPLYGAGPNPAAGDAASLEDAVLRGVRAWCEALCRAGLKMERRPTRCVARELDWGLVDSGSVLELDFVLGRGQFATSVLREILDYRDVARAAGVAPPAAQSG